MEISLRDIDIMNSFKHIWEKPITKSGRNKLNLFILNINANEFNYSYLIENLRDPIIDYSLSRKTKELYKNKAGRLTYKAKEKYKEYIDNNGELGEFLLFCFLEAHLGAPKILSKLELKTSTSMYVHGADGVHYLELPNGDFQLIFGESKTIFNLRDAIYDALISIRDFKNETNKKGDRKSGISYEKSLINTNIDREAFSTEDYEMLKKLIYPKRVQNYYVDDAFGIFIGYEISITAEEKQLNNAEFRMRIQERISSEVESRFKYIEEKIEEYGLIGHDFYFYVLPFTDIDKTRKRILKELL